jgi:hypothetical protein
MQGRSGKIARRGEALGTQDAREDLERQIQNGRRGVYLPLTPKQYRKLRYASRTKRLFKCDCCRLQGHP